MKIGFVFDDSLDKTDGIQQYMFSLAGYYQRLGHQVHYLVGQTTRTDIPNVHSLSRNIKVQFNGNRLSIPLWARTRQVKDLLAREDFDVLHVQVPYHPLMAGRIIKCAASRTVVFGTFHIAPYSRLATFGSRLLGIWSKPTLKKFHKMVSVSSAAADLCRRTFGRTTEIVPNVFDYERFKSGLPLPQYDDDIPTILFLGRLVQRKGCALLLQAVSRLPKGQTFRVVICGAGPLGAALKDYVSANNLDPVVEFTGRISEADKPRYLASADIAVFPSSGGESFGIVLIEAMASGRAAVLGGDNPGYRTVLGERPAQLFNPYDAQELADKLQELLSDEAVRKTAAEWGAAASVQYDVQTVGAKLLAMYQTVAPNNSNE